MPKTGNILSFDELKRARNKEKAGRAFNRLYEDAPSEASQGPRAAVYRGEMGRSQRRATRMQRAGAGQSYGSIQGGSARAAQLSSEGLSLQSVLPAGVSIRFLVVMGVIAMLCVFALSVYPTAQEYYLSVRQHAQIEAETQAVVERTESLAADVEYLKTDSGIEAAAREKLGWVKEGENAVEVYGLPESATKKSNKAETVIASGSVPAPDTWYSPFLDIIFGYDAFT